MEKSYDVHENIHTLANILHSYVRETDGQIKSLQRTAQLLAHGQEVNDTTRLKPTSLDQDENETDEETIIHELEKARLNLVMEIQEENFVSQKLKEMVTESEDLVGGVTRYYNSIQENKLRETQDIQENVKQFSDTIITNVRDKLRTNISTLQNSQSKLYANAREVLDSIERNGTEALSREYQQELSNVIDVLNEKFNALVEKSL